MKHFRSSLPGKSSPLLASVILLSPLVLAASISAATLANYSFPTNNAAGLNASSSTITASAVTPNGTFELFGAQNTTNDGNLSAYGAAVPVLRLGAKSGATSLGAALSLGSYFSITLSPSELTSFSSLSLNAAKGGTGVRGFAVFSSATGFDVSQAATFDSSDALIYSADLAQTRTFNGASYSADLSAETGLQNVAAPVTFYFYVFTNSTQGSIEMDDILFQGTVIPEPGSALLAAISATGLAFRRRVR